MKDLHSVVVYSCFTYFVVSIQETDTFKSPLQQEI